jgi:hypothetical protein
LITQAARHLGWPRVLIGAALVLLGAFFVLALSQAEHFGWGFRFLSAAVYFVVITPAILLIDTLVALFQLIARRQQQSSQQRSWLIGYVVILWVLWGVYFLMVRS